MTATTICITLFVPAVVALFSFSRLGASAPASVFMGIGAAFLLGGGIDAAMFASASPVALVLFSALMAILAGIGAPASVSTLDSSVFMEASDDQGAASVVPLTIRTATGQPATLRPVMIISDNTDDMAAFTRFQNAA